MNGRAVKKKVKQICALIDGELDPTWLRAVATRLAIPLAGLTLTGLSWGEVDDVRPMYGVPNDRPPEALCQELAERLEREDRPCRQLECSLAAECAAYYPARYDVRGRFRSNRDSNHGDAHRHVTPDDESGRPGCRRR